MNGILFNDCFIPAIVSGVKVETRRIIKAPKGAYGFLVATDRKGAITGIYALNADERTEKPNGQEWLIKPRYNVGEVLYIKEACGRVSGIMFYRSDYPEGHKMRTEFKGFANKLFHSASDARHFIKITSVSVERAWKITEEGAIREGVASRAEFEKKWAKINGISSWKSNPYVFVYSFEYLPNYKI